MPNDIMNASRRTMGRRDHSRLSNVTVLGGTAEDTRATGYGHGTPLLPVLVVRLSSSVGRELDVGLDVTEELAAGLLVEDS
eukprot:7757541-Pyramimonas_sp.AAC.1